MDGCSTNINQLPNEMLVKIFSYLSVEDLGLNVQFVCIRWCELSADDVLWKDSLFQVEKDMVVDYILSVLEKVPKLQCFHMPRPTAEIVRKLAECCKNLHKLIVPEFWPKKGTEEALQNLVSECAILEELTIPGGALVNEEIAVIVGQWTKLRVITLTGKSYKQIKLKPIADGCPSLTQLDMGCVDWHYSDVKYFLQQKKNKLFSLGIRPLCFDGTPVFPLLRICGNSLQELLLTETLYVNGNFGWSTFAYIKQLSALTSLKIAIPEGLTADVMVNAFTEEAMCQLQELEIQGNEEINAAVVNTICNNCPNLLRLGLKYSDELNDVGLKYLYRCTNLEQLQLYFCRLLTDSAMDHVVMCSKLKDLSIGHCGIKGKGLCRLIELSELRQLELQGCDVRRLPLDLFPCSLRQLRRLSLKNCGNIEIAAIPVLHAKMPQLSISVDFTK